MWLLYKWSQPSADGKKPAFARMIDSYSYLQEQFAARNKVHTAMIEQAAFDRNLFQSDKKTEHIPMRFPEFVNPTRSSEAFPGGQETGGKMHTDEKPEFSTPVRHITFPLDRDQEESRSWLHITRRSTTMKRRRRSRSSELRPLRERLEIEYPLKTSTGFPTFPIEKRLCVGSAAVL